jgi:hypothetical protein
MPWNGDIDKAPADVPGRAGDEALQVRRHAAKSRTGASQGSNIDLLKISLIDIRANMPP